MEKISIKAFATVSNLGCGFDILGFATDIVSDEIILTMNQLNKIRIVKVSGPGTIPLDPLKNTASVALQAMLDKLGTNQGFDIEINKKVMPGSGLGSSAASSAGVVTGANHLLGEPCSINQLVDFAMEGEKLISGTPHADNVGPAILGGIVLVRGYKPLDLVQLPVPDELFCLILHPQIEVKTADARNILNPQVDLKTAVKQWGNVAGLVAGFYTNDYALISRSVEDLIVEPQRAILIQGYDSLKKAAIDAGAIACNISGSGPSVFALARGIESARKILQAMESQYNSENIPFHSYLTRINNNGVTIE
jgi:homoserine kinase